ncbi:hypothetical protein [Bradyrhizobium genomosp. III]|uniref:hypothetical protein n=1 Tax=Bradyrhizobium genomosp. III TaxID=2683271 RepID=UPI0005781099|nr:hypothetical protein [Bradyrhizobium sp. CCBAU 15615]
MSTTALADANEQKREAAGRTASLLWIATGAYYFATTEKAGFLSWQAVLFFVGGMFVAALVFGAASHYLFAAYRNFYLNYVRGKLILATVAALGSLLLNVFEIGAPIVVARWVFLGLYGLD